MKKNHFNWQYSIIGVFLAIIVLGFFWILNNAGIISGIQINSNSSLLTFFIFGFLASISSCAIFTGMIILSLTETLENSRFGKSKAIFTFQIGRILSFALFGLLLGFLGKILNINPMFNAILMTIIAILMLILGLNFLGIPLLKYLPKNKKILKILNSEKTGFWWIILIGVLTFFVPCGFTYTAQLLALSTANPIQASLIMLSFVLGTTPILILIGYFGFFLNSSRKALNQILNCFIGCIVLIFGLYTLNNQLGVFGIPNISFSNIEIYEEQEEIYENNKIMAIYTKAGMSPNTIKLKVGQTYKIIISVKDTIQGCMSTIFLQGLDENIQMLNAGTTIEFNFTTTKKGTFEFLCAMGAKHRAKVVVE